MFAHVKKLITFPNLKIQIRLANQPDGVHLWYLCLGIFLLTQIRNKRKTTFCVVYICSRTVYKTMNPFPTCSSPFSGFPAHSTPPGTQSDQNTGDDHNFVSGSNRGSLMVVMQIPSYQQTMLTSSSILFQEFQNCQVNIDMHSLIFETDKTAISPLFQGF